MEKDNTSQAFVHWLQSYLELSNSAILTRAEVNLIKEKLEQVLKLEKTPNSFCIFLNGYFTLSDPQTVEPQVLTKIKKMLTHYLVETSAVDSTPAPSIFSNSAPHKPSGSSNVLRC